MANKIPRVPVREQDPKVLEQWYDDGYQAAMDSMDALRAQIYEMCEEKGEYLAMSQARSQAMHYMKGLRGAASLRRYCSMLEHFTDVDTLIDAVYRLQE